VAQVPVGADENIEPAFSRSQEFAVAQTRPTELESGFDLMAGEMLPQRDRRALVEQNTHTAGALRGLETAGRVLEDVVNLLAGDAGEPFQELLDRGAAFDVLE
jgi:hypothetical protein